MALTHWLIFLGFLALVTGANNDVKKSAEKLLVDELINENYDVRVRPVENASDTVNVYVGVDIVRILSVNEVHGELSLVMWLRLKWNDTSLKWDPDRYENISEIVIDASTIWKPDISLFNGIDEFSVKQLGYSEVIVDSEGTVYWIPSAHVTVSCQITTALFPFDRHQCEVHWGSWLHDNNTIDLYPDGIEMQDFEENSKWIMSRMDVSRRAIRYNCCVETYPRIVVTISLNRHASHYIFGLILPCIIFSFLIVLQFLIPPDIGERVVYSIVALMLLTVFGCYTSSFVPQANPSIPLIAIYVFLLILGAAAAVTNTCLVANFYHTKFNFTMRPWVKELFLNFIPKVLCMKQEADYAFKQMTLRRKSTMKKPMPDMEPLLDRQTSAPVQNAAAATAGGSDSGSSATVSPIVMALLEIIRDVRDMGHAINLQLVERKGSPEWKYAAEAVNRFGLFTVTLYFIICHAVIIIYAIAAGVN